jgi:hypothetical protein
MFPARVISRRGNIEWSTRSPHLNACDFFLWGYLKSKVYEKKLRTTKDLKKNISKEVAPISPTMLQRVMQNFQNACGDVLTTDDTSQKPHSESEYCN